eukprot:5964011-Heterocapsa_arctica.AAC.1
MDWGHPGLQHRDDRREHVALLALGQERRLARALSAGGPVLRTRDRGGRLAPDPQQRSRASHEAWPRLPR